MVSYTDFRNNKRFEQKSIFVLADEHTDYCSHAQIFNFSSGGLYFESHLASKLDIKIQI